MRALRRPQSALCEACLHRSRSQHPQKAEPEHDDRLAHGARRFGVSEELWAGETGDQGRSYEQRDHRCRPLDEHPAAGADEARRRMSSPDASR